MEVVGKGVTPYPLVIQQSDQTVLVPSVNQSLAKKGLTIDRIVAYRQECDGPAARLNFYPPPTGRANIQMYHFSGQRARDWGTPSYSRSCHRHHRAQPASSTSGHSSPPASSRPARSTATWPALGKLGKEDPHAINNRRPSRASRCHEPTGAPPRQDCGVGLSTAHLNRRI